MTLIFNIHSPSELSAGLVGFDDTVKIEIESGNPGGDPGKFAKETAQFLQDWYDGAQVTLVGIVL